MSDTTSRPALSTLPARGLPPRWRAAVSLLAALAMSASTVLMPAPAAAQAPKLGIIRDAEIEQLLREYATPLLNAAHVNAGATRIILVGDRTFNAFVAGGRNIFVNVGAIIEAETPNEMIGVLAHEIGHIAGGHLARQRMELDRAAVMAVAGMLMSAGTLVATSRSRNIGSDGAGTIGVMLGPQEIIRRSLLAYQRGEEQAADIAAVKYLNATHQSARGLLTTLERFRKDSLFRSTRIDPYLLSHPLPAERLSYLETAAHQSPYWNAVDPPARLQRHAMIRAKLIAFLGDAAEVQRRYPLGDNSMAASYARAISAYRFGRLTDALARIDALIRARPKNPFFHELKGQALLEAGRPHEAIAPLRHAAAMLPSAIPIRVMLGHALVSTGNPADAAEAIRVLTKVTQSERENAEAFQFLAMAYERRGDTAMAQLSAAQALFLAGKYVEARTQASRAQKQFKQGSPGWIKSDDILTYRPPKE